MIVRTLVSHYLRLSRNSQCQTRVMDAAFKELICKCGKFRKNFDFLEEGLDLNFFKPSFKYWRSRRWGFQLLIRLSASERVLIRHFILFCVGVILSLSFVDSYVSDIKAFMEFRTNIMKRVNFTGFDNVKGAEREIIPNYIHYIRLQQPQIRY